MDKAKIKKIAVLVVVTFLEAAGAQLLATGFDLSNKTVLAGAFGAGLSAAYNVIKHYIYDANTASS